MATRELERTVQRPLLDRLIDNAPREAADPPMSMSESVRRLRDSVLRDVEWLLNTRRTIEPAGDAFPELRESLYHYGMPDLTSLSADSNESYRRLLGEVERLIESFEPRLTGVRVSLSEEDDTETKQVRFLIRGVLCMEPDPERVVFDTVLEVASGRFTVLGGGNA